MILEQGNTNIPFTAVRNMYKYELFVTNISCETGIDTIKQHISAMLGAEVSIKLMSKAGASCLSFGLLFSSEFDNQGRFSARRYGQKSSANARSGAQQGHYS